MCGVNPSDALKAINTSSGRSWVHAATCTRSCLDQKVRLRLLLGKSSQVRTFGCWYVGVYALTHVCVTEDVDTSVLGARVVDDNAVDGRKWIQ